MNNKSQVKGVLAIIDELSRFLEEENASIRNRDFKQIKERTMEKNILANKYENMVMALKDDTVSLKGISERDRTVLRDFGDKLNELVLANAILLTARREATQHVIKAFAEAVKETQTPNSTYSPSGTLSRDAPQPKRVLAASIDQSL